MHNEEFRNCVKPISQLFINKVKNLNESSLPKNDITCIFELSPLRYQRFKSDDNSSNVLFNTLKKLVFKHLSRSDLTVELLAQEMLKQQNSDQQTVVTFVNKDPRGLTIGNKVISVSDDLTVFFEQEVSKVLGQAHSSLFGTVNKRKKFFKPIRDKRKLLHSKQTFSINDFFLTIKEWQKNIAKWRDDFKENSAEYLALESIGKKIETCFEKIKLQYLVNKAKNKNLITTLLDIIQNQTTLQQAFNVTKELFGLFQEGIDYSYADAAFLYAIFIDQKKCTKTILVSGEAHALATTQYLETCGYTKSSAQTILTNIDDPKGLFMTYLVAKEIPQFEKNLTVVLNSFSFGQNTQLVTSTEENRNTSDGKEETQTKQTTDRRCASCEKLATEDKDLLRCSRCKNAYYCSQLCQRAHWGLHKLECKKQ